MKKFTVRYAKPLYYRVDVEAADEEAAEVAAGALIEEHGLEYYYEAEGDAEIDELLPS